MWQVDAAPEAIGTRLGLGSKAPGVLARLAAVPLPREPVRLATSAEVITILRRLRVAEADIGEVLAARPSARQNPDLWWLLERCNRELVNDMGGLGTIAGWPTLPAQLGPIGRYFYVWVFLSTISDLRKYHSRRGIPEEITWATLAELGTQMWYRRSICGDGGLHTQEWVTAHFRGVLYRLGRLLFERQRIWFDAERDGGDRPPRRGAWALGVHIPRGRLTPESCDKSFMQACAFFSRYFPEEPYLFATCVSWVLDDQLRAYLSPGSNILRFQRRFHLLSLGATTPSDQATVEAIFARRWTHATDTALLPQATHLEHAVVTHLRAGRHWYYRTGWLPIVAGK